MRLHFHCNSVKEECGFRTTIENRMLHRFGRINRLFFVRRILILADSVRTCRIGKK